MRILFIHEGFGQFQTLDQHLNATGLAESWFLCSTGVHDANKDRVANLVPFRMVAENPKSYFYTRGLEARTQRSFLLREANGKLIEHTPIDVIVAHGSGGFPLQIFDSFDIPVISYIEFPSFTAHGYDARYPQPEYAAYRDRLFEMTSYHQAVKSDMTIVPSEYARRMFPACLHVIVYGVWHVVPFAFIVFYAGLQSVPQDALEAATIDGASRWQRLRYVTLPHLMPLVVFVTLIHLMDAYRVFEPVLVLTQGAFTTSVQYLTYYILLQENNPYKASAAAVLTLLGILVLLIPLLVRTWREQKGGV